MENEQIIATEDSSEFARVNNSLEDHYSHDSVNELPMSTVDDMELEGAEDFRFKMIGDAKNRGYVRHCLFDSLAERLEELGQYKDIQPVHCPEKHVGRQKFSLDGVAYDEETGKLVLFYLDCNSSKLPGDLDTAYVRKLVTKVRNFYELSVQGRLDVSVLDYYSDESALALWIHERARLDNHRRKTGESLSLAEIEICILTTARKRKAVKNRYEPNGLIKELAHSVTVWDYHDFYLWDKSTRALVVDFKKKPLNPLRLLPAVTVEANAGYRAYVGMISGNVLADIYEEFGQRVLAGNVRAFLNTTIKVNKGIKRTIETAPKKFFAFNNGICVVCSDVTIVENNGVAELTEAKDFQIVNGGQTTVSLFDARKKNKDVDLRDIAVPIKLTVLSTDSEVASEGEKHDFVLEIAKYANSQTAVTESDLGSSTPFQVKFQDIGFSGNCSYQNGDGYLSYWFYERTRGEYKVVMRNAASKKDFERTYPTLFTKLEMAKWLLAWNEAPNIVSLGGQKCYVTFQKYMNEKEMADPELSFCTVQLFKETVAKGILFRTVDRLVRESDWYIRHKSYKANLVAYAVSLFAKLVREELKGEKTLNWGEIWKEQLVPMDLHAFLRECAYRAYLGFNHESREIDDVGEWVKKAGCWDLIRNTEGVLESKELRQRFQTEILEKRPDLFVKSSTNFVLAEWTDFLPKNDRQ